MGSRPSLNWTERLGMQLLQLWDKGKHREYYPEQTCRSALASTKRGGC